MLGAILHSPILLYRVVVMHGNSYTLYISAMKLAEEKTGSKKYHFRRITIGKLTLSVSAVHEIVLCLFAGTCV
jgi:hypothetical protein